MISNKFFLKNINYVPLLFIAFINFVFSYKYIHRVSEHALLISIIYSCFFIFIPYLISLVNNKLYSYTVLLLLLLFTGISIFLLSKISVHVLNVDRWSVITSFWDAFRNGQFPYMARSHMNNLPGPFPIYFILSFPFYCVGEIGYITIVSVLLFIGYIYKNYGKGKAILALIVLLSSACIWWEVVARSTVFGNSVLLFIYIDCLYNAGLSKIRSLIVYGIAGGLILSTRGILIIPLTLTFAFVFIRIGKWKGLFTCGIILVFSFICTLIPFILLNPSLFMRYNSFNLQTVFVPSWVQLIFIVTAFLIGILLDTTYKVILYIGFILFASVIVYMVYDITRFDFESIYLGGISDISYFSFSMPFFLFCLLRPSIQS